ncbi:MAG: YopX family protein [Snowella sp.]|nr:YopX family protein [Snowella sp.]
MRELKFRAWDFKKNRFVENDLDLYDRPNANVGEYAIGSNGKLCFFESTEGGMETIEFDDSEIEVSWYTGLKDKNRKEIYEGDCIMELTESIGWCEKCVGWQIVGKYDNESICHRCDGDYSLDELVDENGLLTEQVIGNIYENPDLLQ